MVFYRTNGVWHRGNGSPIRTCTLSLGHDKDVTVPREVAEEAYKEYAAQFGTSQSLDRLNERGGFGVSEIAILLFERIKRLEAAGK